MITPDAAVRIGPAMLVSIQIAEKNSTTTIRFAEVDAPPTPWPLTQVFAGTDTRLHVHEHPAGADAGPTGRFLDSDRESDTYFGASDMYQCWSIS